MKHIPRVFLILGLYYASLQILGILYLFEPSENELQESDLTLLGQQPTKTDMSPMDVLST